MSTTSSLAQSNPLVGELQASPPNALLSIATACWAMELYILYGRIFDFALSGLRIPAIVFGMLMITFFASGQGFSGLFSVTGRVVLSFVAWVTITLAFSIWKSGSLTPYEQLLNSLAFFVVASGFSASLRAVKVALYSLAVAGLGAALESFVWGSSFYGRQILYRGNYHDPNEYALILLMSLPFWWLMAASAKSAVAKIAALACTIPVYYIFARTGSRGALLGFGVTMLILFAKASLPKKMLIGSITVVAVVGGLAVMPDYIRARYLTYFDVQPSSVDAPQGAAGRSEMERLKSDVDSADSRKLLLLKSIDLTFRYPIFGVGPGNFPVAVFDDAKHNGEGYSWLVTHNTYTQISSETGIPGFVLFVTIVLLSFRNVGKVLKLTKPEGAAPDGAIYNAAHYLRLCLVGVFTSIFFLSFGYYPLAYILAGLTVALHKVATTHADRWAAAGLITAQPASQEQTKPPAPSMRLPVGRLSNGKQAAASKGVLEERPRPARFNRYR